MVSAFFGCTDTRKVNGQVVGRDGLCERRPERMFLALPKSPFLPVLCRRSTQERVMSQDKAVPKLSPHTGKYHSRWWPHSGISLWDGDLRVGYLSRWWPRSGLSPELVTSQWAIWGVGRAGVRRWRGSWRWRLLPPTLLAALFLPSSASASGLPRGRAGVRR